MDWLALHAAVKDATNLLAMSEVIHDVNFDKRFYGNHRAAFLEKWGGLAP